MSDPSKKDDGNNNSSKEDLFEQIKRIEEFPFVKAFRAANAKHDGTGSDESSSSASFPELLRLLKEEAVASRTSSSDRDENHEFINSMVRKTKDTTATIANVLHECFAEANLNVRDVTRDFTMQGPHNADSSADLNAFETLHVAYAYLSDEKARKKYVRRLLMLCGNTTDPCSIEQVHTGLLYYTTTTLLSATPRRLEVVDIKGRSVELQLRPTVTPDQADSFDIFAAHCCGILIIINDIDSVLIPRTELKNLYNASSLVYRKTIVFPEWGIYHVCWYPAIWIAGQKYKTAQSDAIEIRLNDPLREQASRECLELQKLARSHAGQIKQVLNRFKARQASAHDRDELERRSGILRDVLNKAQSIDERLQNALEDLGTDVKRSKDLLFMRDAVKEALGVQDAFVEALEHIATKDSNKRFAKNVAAMIETGEIQSWMENIAAKDIIPNRLYQLLVEGKKYSSSCSQSRTLKTAAKRTDIFSEKQCCNLLKLAREIEQHKEKVVLPSTCTSAKAPISTASPQQTTLLLAAPSVDIVQAAAISASPSISNSSKTRDKPISIGRCIASSSKQNSLSNTAQKKPVSSHQRQPLVTQPVASTKLRQSQIRHQAGKSGELVLLHKSLMSKFIGKYGTHVDSIRMDSGANIFVEQTPDDHGNCNIWIYGSSRSRKKARHFIAEFKRKNVDRASTLPASASVARESSIDIKPAPEKPALGTVISQLAWGDTETSTSDNAGSTVKPLVGSFKKTEEPIPAFVDVGSTTSPPVSSLKNTETPTPCSKDHDHIPSSGFESATQENINKKPSSTDTCSKMRPLPLDHCKEKPSSTADSCSRMRPLPLDQCFFAAPAEAEKVGEDRKSSPTTVLSSLEQHLLGSLLEPSAHSSQVDRWLFDFVSSSIENDDQALLRFLQNHQDCLKIPAHEFFAWLVSEDVISLPLLSEAVEDSDFMDAMHINGVNKFKQAAFRKGVADATNISSTSSVPVSAERPLSAYELALNEYLLSSGLPKESLETVGAFAPPQLQCPISSTLMVVDPVVSADGMTYERYQIEAWINQKLAQGEPVTSPQTGQVLHHLQLSSNISVRSLARQYLEDRARRKPLFR